MLTFDSHVRTCGPTPSPAYCLLVISITIKKLIASQRSTESVIRSCNSLTRVTDVRLKGRVDKIVEGNRGVGVVVAFVACFSCDIPETNLAGNTDASSTYPTPRPRANAMLGLGWWASFETDCAVYLFLELTACICMLEIDMVAGKSRVHVRPSSVLEHRKLADREVRRSYQRWIYDSVFDF